MATIKLTTQDIKDKVFNYESEQDWKYQGQLPAIIDFYADWCGPCKMMKPVLAELKHKVGDKATILKIDVDKNQQMAAQYQVRGVPTMILFQAGRQLWRQSGVVSKEEIIKTIFEKSN